MHKPLRLLIIDDSEDDALLLVREIRKGEYTLDWKRVWTADALEEAISGETWDLVLSDYVMPGFGGLDALRLIKERGIPVPFIVVSGKMGEETAVEVMRAGADDYILKGRLARLLPAIERELHEAARRRRAEEEIRHAAIQWQTTFDAAHDLYQLLDKEYRMTRVNRATTEFLGLPAEGIVDARCFTLFHGTDAPPPGCPLARMRQSGQHEEAELWNEKHGIWMSVSVDPVFDKGGRLCQVVHIIKDITVRKRAEEALRMSEEKFAKAFHTIPTILTISRLKDGRFIDVNETFLEKFGFSREEVIGRTSVDLHIRRNTDDRRRLLELMTTSGSVHDMEFTFQTKDGGTIVGLFSGETIELNGETCLISMVNDITERKQAEEKIRQHMENLAALRMIDAAITSTLDLPTTLTVLLEQTVRRLKADAACVLLCTPACQMLEYAAGRGFRTERITAARVRLGEGYAGSIARERSTRVIADLTGAEEGKAPLSLIETEGFRAYIGIPLIAKDQIKGVLEVFHRAPFAPDTEWLEFAEALAGQAAIAIDNAELFDNLQRSHRELLMAYDTTIEGWAQALDLRDKETEGHSRRVTAMTERLALAAGVGEEELVHIRRGALLHDIGKLGVPDSILLKPSALSATERGVMTEHPEIARRLLATIDFLKPAIAIPYCHHEKWDGTGYPRGLKGEKIPLAARIFAVIDVYDALCADRPYRAAWTAEEARGYIRAHAGTFFDPAVVDLFLSMDWNETDCAA